MLLTNYRKQHILSSMIIDTMMLAFIFLVGLLSLASWLNQPTPIRING